MCATTARGSRGATGACAHTGAVTPSTASRAHDCAANRVARSRVPMYIERPLSHSPCRAKGVLCEVLRARLSVVTELKVPPRPAALTAAPPLIVIAILVRKRILPARAHVWWTTTFETPRSPP